MLLPPLTNSAQAVWSESEKRKQIVRKRWELYLQLLCGQG